MSRCCMLLLAFVAAALQAGCLFHERDVTFHVTDEVTGAAIRGVRVSVVHQASKINHPGSRSGLTDEAGEVVLRLTRGSILWHPATRVGWGLYVKADGYAAYATSVPRKVGSQVEVRAWEGSEPFHAGSLIVRDSDDVEIRLAPTGSTEARAD